MATDTTVLHEGYAPDLDMANRLYEQACLAYGADSLEARAALRHLRIVEDAQIDSGMLAIDPEELLAGAPRD